MARLKVALRSGLTQERLKEKLRYDPATGLFTWREWGRGEARSPKAAGRINKDGYRRIQIDREIYQGSHLAWLYVTGRHPDCMLNHRNSNHSDDRFNNLRPAASVTQIKANCVAYKTNRLGIKGVRLHRNGQYEARLRLNGRLQYLGCYRTVEEAKAVYDKAAGEAFGEFARS